MANKPMREEVSELQNGLRKLQKGFERHGKAQENAEGRLEKRIDYIQSMEAKQGRSIGGIKATYLPRIRKAEANIGELKEKYDDHESTIIAHAEGLGEHETRLGDYGERLRLLERGYFERARDALVGAYSWFFVEVGAPTGDESPTEEDTTTTPTAREKPGYLKRFFMGMIGFTYVGGGEGR